MDDVQSPNYRPQWEKAPWQMTKLDTWPQYYCTSVNILTFHLSSVDTLYGNLKGKSKLLVLLYRAVLCCVYLHGTDFQREITVLWFWKPDQTVTVLLTRHYLPTVISIGSHNICHVSWQRKQAHQRGRTNYVCACLGLENICIVGPYF